MKKNRFTYQKVRQTRDRFFFKLQGRPCVLQEKIDGSQISFWMDPEDQLHVCSKRYELDLENPPKLFRGAVNHLLSVAHLMGTGYIYYGECLQTPGHNNITYDRIPKNHIMLFDVVSMGGSFVPHYEIAMMAVVLDIETIPQFAEIEAWGTVRDMRAIEDLMSTKSVLGGSKIEGVVIKDIADHTQGFTSSFSARHKGDTVIHMSVENMGRGVFKVVSPEYSEKSGAKKWKGDVDTVLQLATQYNCVQRFNKAIQHLRDDGTLTNSPKDIGPLMKELNNDFEEEETENIKSILWNKFRKTFIREMSKGFPDYYKGLLERGVEAPEAYGHGTEDELKHEILSRKKEYQEPMSKRLGEE